MPVLAFPTHRLFLCSYLSNVVVRAFRGLMDTVNRIEDSCQIQDGNQVVQGQDGGLGLSSIFKRISWFINSPALDKCPPPAMC